MTGFEPATPVPYNLTLTNWLDAIGIYRLPDGVLDIVRHGGRDSANRVRVIVATWQGNGLVCKRLR